MRDTDGPDMANRSIQGEPAKGDMQLTPGLKEAEQILGPDVAALGMRIIAELGGDDAPLLARWMSLRIAELMHQTQEATDAATREEAARACADLVLRVWEKRSNWPQGWPPESANHVITALEQRNQWQRARVPEQDQDLSWLTALPAAFDSIEEEQELWRLVALAATDPSDIRAWLEQPGAALGEQERNQLESIAEAAGRADEQLTERLTSHQRRRIQQQSEQKAPLTADQRDELTLRQMRRLARARLKLADRVVAAAKMQALASLQNKPEDGAIGQK
ncbi:hypothetical protein ABZ806_33335 [Spirillospora sp. NPDC047418]